MIPRGVEVFVALEPIDLRWSFDRLAGIVVDRLGREPRSRALFVFVPVRRSPSPCVIISALRSTDGDARDLGSSSS